MVETSELIGALILAALVGLVSTVITGRTFAARLDERYKATAENMAGIERRLEAALGGFTVEIGKLRDAIMQFSAFTGSQTAATESLCDRLDSLDKRLHAMEQRR